MHARESPVASKSPGPQHDPDDFAAFPIDKTLRFWGLNRFNRYLNTKTLSFCWQAMELAGDMGAVWQNAGAAEFMEHTDTIIRGRARGRTFSSMSRTRCA